MSILFGDSLCCAALEDLPWHVAALAVAGSFSDCLIVCATISFLMFHTPRAGMLGIGSLLCLAVNVGLKQLIADARPAGSCLDSYGMPSGDVQMISFVAITLSVLFRLGVVPRILLALLVVAEAASRVTLGHHTVLQTVAGALVGSVTGVLWVVAVVACFPSRGKRKGRK